MTKNRTIFLYGPQTAGKTTRLLRIIKRDHGKDILMSGEDRNRVSNGREVCDVTLRVPGKWSPAGRDRFIKNVREQLPVEHVLVDGVQFLSKRDVINVGTLVDQVDPHVPIIFAGCRYGIATKGRPPKELPTSRFLMKRCNRTVPVNRRCDFCNRLATQFCVSDFKRLGANKIVAVDPHLVCDVHYQRLRNDG